MYLKKHSIKILTAFLLLNGNLIFDPNIHDLTALSVAHAEIKEYSGKGAAMISFGENNENIVNMIKLQAKEEAIKDAREKAGVYIKSYSESKNNILTKDEVIIVTNNVVDIVKVDYEKSLYNAYDARNNPLGEIGVRYEARVKVKIDTDDIQKYLKLDEKEKATLIAQIKNMQKYISTDNDKRLEDINKQAVAAKTKEDIIKIKNELEHLETDLQVNQKIEQGNKYYYNKNYIFATDSYVEALKMKTFIGVGENVAGLGESLEKSKKYAYDRAISDIQDQNGVIIQLSQETKDGKLIKDEMTTTVIHPSKIEVVDVKYEYAPDNLGMRIKAIVTAKISIDDIKEFENQFKELYK